MKLLKGHRKQHPFGLSAEAEDLLSQHILPTDWYPFGPVRQLIEVTYCEILKKSSDAALQLGVAGGTAALQSYHKTFIRPDDPLASLLAMRNSWRLYFGFGELTVAPDCERAVRFVLEGYPDLTAAHGSMIVGWHRAAALVAGAKSITGEILECPWTERCAKLVHRVSC